MSGGHGDAPAPSPRADLVLAAVFFVFAAAVVTQSALMPTFVDQGTPLYVAPGIVPGFYGIMLGLLSIVLATRSLVRGALRPAGEGEASPPQSLLRTGIAVALALVFVLGMIGRMPFWLAATLFVFAFVMIFEWEPHRPAAAIARNAAIAAAIGLATGIGITTLFERVFLISMP